MATVNKTTVTVNKPVVNKQGKVTNIKKVKFKKTNKQFVEQVKEDKKLIKSFEKAYKQADAAASKETPVQKVKVTDVKYDERDLKESSEILKGFRETFDDIESEKRWKLTIKRSGQFLTKLVKDLGIDLWGVISNLGLTVWLLIVMLYKAIATKFKKAKKD